MSKQMLHSLALNPKTRLLYSTQRSREPIFPFCVYEAKSAMGGTIGFAENEGAVGVATAAALLSELAKLSGAAASTSPPVIMLASMGYAWTIHACVASTIGHTDHFHIYPVITILDMRNPLQLFLFQVYLSRIREYRCPPSSLG